MARAIGAEFNPHEGPQPIAVMMESDPWLIVIGSDLPSFVLYEDGRAIYLKKEGNHLQFVTKMLVATELREAKRRLAALIPSKPVEPFYDLKPNVTDLPTTSFFLAIDGKRLVTSIRAMNPVKDDSSLWKRLAASRKTKYPPAEIARLRALIGSFSFRGEQKWVPKYVEVMLTPYENAPQESIHWPKEWPGINSATSRQRREQYSIFVNGDLKPAIVRFLGTAKEQGAVEVGGKGWAVSLRDTFPSEPVWFDLFRAGD